MITNFIKKKKKKKKKIKKTYIPSELHKLADHVQLNE